MRDDPFAPRVGGILSADIAVPDHDREVRFYSQVLSTGEEPLWREDLMNNRGMPVIGLGPRSAEYDDLPLQWMPHIQVANVAGSVERALRLGGRELMHGKDGDGNSQWAVLLDPHGAAFGLIPVVSAEVTPSAEDVGPSQSAPRVGCIAWLDLTVPDVSVTCDFYQQVVGWSAQDVVGMDTGGRSTAYQMCVSDGSPVAGVCQDRAGSRTPSAIWMIYLPVDDLAESLRRVEDGGGTIVESVRGPDGEHGRAVVQDPVGVCFGLVQEERRPDTIKKCLVKNRD